MKGFKRYIVFFQILLAIVSCRREIEKPNWDTNILVPILKTTLGVKDVLKDTTYTIGKDSSIYLVYDKVLDSFSLNVLDTLSVPSYYKSFGLSAINFPENKIEQVITLGQLARQLTLSTDTATILSGIIILTNQGSTVQLQPRENLSAGPYEVDATNLFQTAVIKSGSLEIKITNNLPVALTEARFQLSNKSTPTTPFGDVSFTTIDPGQSQSHIIDLAQTTLEGNLVANAPVISFGGGNGIVIDTNASIKIELVLRDIKVANATAYFPTQNVIQDQQEIILGELEKGLELKAVRFKSAKVRIQIYSTIPERLYFTYKLPNAISKDNVPFSIEGSVLANLASSGPAYDVVKDFAGYTLDLSGKPGHNIVNAFYSDLTASIQKSITPISLSEMDSLSVKISMSEIRPDYIRGFIEKDTSLKGEVTFDFFKEFSATSLNFETVEVSLRVQNSFGIAGQITTDYIQSKNKNGKTVSLSDNALIGVPKTVLAATDNPFHPNETIIGTDKASPLLSIFPTSVGYQFGLKTGNNLTPRLYTDFAYDFSAIKPSLRISIPLQFGATGIVLSDTVQITPELASNIRKGNISLIAYNGFPFQAALTLKFLDVHGTILDSLSSPQLIKEGKIDPLTTKVKNKEKSKIQYSFDENKIYNLSQSDKIIFHLKLDTKPENTTVKIFPDYDIDFKIVGDVVYRVQ